MDTVAAAVTRKSGKPNNSTPEEKQGENGAENGIEPEMSRSEHASMRNGKNAEGYQDPTASIAISRTDRERRKGQRMKQRKKAEMHYRTTREQYKAVKKYDHTQFDTFCTSIYKSGYDDGRAAVPGLDVKDALEVIRSVKRIGDKRIAEIEARLNERYEAGTEGK